LYFWLSYIPDPYSAFQSVRKLPAGGWLKMDSAGKVTEGRYWNCPPPNPNERPESEKPAAQQRLVELFDQSVKARLIADVPLGAFLSGGIDSSLVVASMALQTTEPVKTFSIGFEESDFSELPYARMVAERYGTDHHELVVKPDSINLADRLARHFDEPFADSSAIPTLMVSEFARRHVKVALSGDGGDELFAGYTRFQQAKDSRKFDLIPTPLRSLIGSVAEAMPYSARGKNYLRMISRGDSIERYFEANYAPYFMRRRLFSSQWVAPADRAFLQRALNGSLLGEPYGAVEQALHYETTANLVGDMLVKVDRMSMAASLEVRCPLLDHLLGEFAADLPTSWKMQPGQGKKILIDALGSRLPPRILNRPKQGFGVPIAHWFRTSMHDFIRDTLTSKPFLDQGFVSPDFLSALIDEHQRGRRDNSHWLWSLLMLERWQTRMKEFQPS
jgi:asparagine synthase (glutamine-hydrolysing)